MRSLKPTMSPKKIVTQSKFSAETWMKNFHGGRNSPFLLSLPLGRSTQTKLLSYKNNNLLQLDVPDNGEWQKVVEGFLGLHLLLVQLLHLLNHLLCKHLEICGRLKSLFTSITFWRKNIYQGTSPVSQWGRSWRKSRKGGWWGWKHYQLKVK